MYAWTDGLPSYINPLFINPLPPYDRGPLALYDRNVYFYVQINYLTSYVLSYVMSTMSDRSRNRLMSPKYLPVNNVTEALHVHDRLDIYSSSAKQLRTCMSNSLFNLIDSADY